MSTLPDLFTAARTSQLEPAEVGPVWTSDPVTTAPVGTHLVDETGAGYLAVADGVMSTAYPVRFTRWSDLGDVVLRDPRREAFAKLAAWAEAFTGQEDAR